MKDVNVSNFTRAETDVAIKKIYDMVGLGNWLHLRAPTPIDQQTVIRMNRDTLYSAVVVDLSEPVTVIMPETGGRYQSLQVINQDHYSFAKTKPGRYELTQTEVGTRYAQLTVRTFMDANDPEDIKVANTLQDALKIEGGDSGALDVPD
ncbi:DUF1254 domain-containing protein [Chloroflexota bacterium]